MPHPAAPSPTIKTRYDLRTGRVVAGRIEAGYLSTPEHLTRALQAALPAWRMSAGAAPLSAALSERLARASQVDALQSAVLKAGLAPGGFNFEIEERWLMAGAIEAAQDLRSRGWGVGLRADPSCPIPFGSKARALYQEVIVSAPAPPSPYLGFDVIDADPLGRRIAAARAAGLALTAEGVERPQDAKAWLLAGFDRAEGGYRAAVYAPRVA